METPLVNSGKNVGKQNVRKYGRIRKTGRPFHLLISGGWALWKKYAGPPIYTNFPF